MAIFRLLSICSMYSKYHWSYCCLFRYAAKVEYCSRASCCIVPWPEQIKEFPFLYTVAWCRSSGTVSPSPIMEKLGKWFRLFITGKDSQVSFPLRYSLFVEGEKNQGQSPSIISHGPKGNRRHQPLCSRKRVRYDLHFFHINGGGRPCLGHVSCL